MYRPVNSDMIDLLIIYQWIVERAEVSTVIQRICTEMTKLSVSDLTMTSRTLKAPSNVEMEFGTCTMGY